MLIRYEIRLPIPSLCGKEGINSMSFCVRYSSILCPQTLYLSIPCSMSDTIPSIPFPFMLFIMDVC